MYFRWADGKLAMLGMTFSGPIGRNDGGTELLTLLTFLVGDSPQEIEGDPKLLQRPITGDFIVREGASREKVTSRLEEILRRECGLQLKLTFRQVERKVTVAHGRYRFTPLPGRAADQAENQIELYGKQLYGDGSPGGGGDFRQFLKGTGLFLGHRVVGEVEGAPTAGMTWRYHRRSPATEEQTKEDTDPKGVLKHVSEQTGLTFKEETRRVAVLFVQRAEEPAEQPMDRKEDAAR
jgi:hypothetical protein